MNGREIAGIAKHTPELLDPDDVRQAGRRLELFEGLRLEAVWRDDEGGWWLTVHAEDDDLLALMEWWT